MMRRPGHVARRLLLRVAAIALLSGCAADPEVQPVPADPSTTTIVVATEPPSTSAPTIASTTTSLPPPLPDPSPPIPSPGNNKLLVVGDSVILGAANTVPRELVGWKVTFDARESRFITNGLDVLKAHKAEADKAQAKEREDLEKAYADAGLTPPKADPPRSIPDVLGRVVVVHLCTNYEAGGGFATFIDRIMDYLDELDRVVWVTCAEWSAGQTEADKAIVEASARYPKLVVADWAAFSITPGYTYDDQIHLREPGQEEIAKLLARAVGPAPTPHPPPTTTTLPKPTIPPSTTTVPGPDDSAPPP